MGNIFTDHPREILGREQSYWQHGRVAFINSCRLVWYGFVGILHAFCPWWFPFYTSSGVIKVFKILVDSRRHIGELREVMLEGYVVDEHLW